MADTVVLCYHALSKDWPATLNVQPDRFERQVEFMLERGYKGRTFSEAVCRKAASKTLVVTFDDAFQSVLETGLPILRRLGIPATVFAVSSFPSRGGPLVWEGIDQWRDGPHSHELIGMTWDELRSLAELGWEVGSHTVSHPHLSQATDDELRNELVASREDVTRELGECKSIAYPYGDVDARVAAAARSAGYSAAAALPGHIHREHPLEWPRIGVWWGDDMRRFRLKVLRPVRRAHLLLRR